MPRKSRKSGKSSKKNKVDKNRTFKLCQDVGEKQFLDQQIRQANVNPIYINKLQQCKSFVIKKTLTNEKLGRIIYGEFDDHIYIWILNILPQKQRKGWGTAVVNYLKEKGKPIGLHCYMNDNDAIDFWLQMGFMSDVNNSIDVDLGFIYQPN